MRHDLTGQRFFRLVAIEFVEKRKKQLMWKCKCDCGNETIVSACNLLHNHTKSCGCYAKELSWRKGHTSINKGLALTYTEPKIKLHPIIYALRRKRYLLRITQAQLAARMGWDKRTISQAERGACVQSFQMVENWAEALGFKLTLTPTIGKETSDE